MQRVRVTRAEKIAARYTRGSRHDCWPWEGSFTDDGLPRLNNDLVTRYIFEQEFGTIPAGYVLWRDDHDDTCRPGRTCRHARCVNPHHLRLVKSWGGIYERKKKGQDAIEGDQEDHDADRDAG
jgi:hypothetical protein